MKPVSAEERDVVLLCDSVIICIFGDKLTQIGNWGIVQHIAFISQIYHHSYHKPTPLHDVTRKHKYYFAIVLQTILRIMVMV